MLTRGQRRSRRHSADRCHGVGRWWRRSTADQAHCVEPFSRATIDPGRDLARGTYLMILGLQYRRATDKNWNYWLGLDSGGAVKDRRRACWRVLVRDRQSTVEMDVVHNDRIRTLCGYVEAKHGGSIPRTPQLQLKAAGQGDRGECRAGGATLDLGGTTAPQVLLAGRSQPGGCRTPSADQQPAFPQAGREPRQRLRSHRQTGTATATPG